MSNPWDSDTPVKENMTGSKPIAQSNPWDNDTISQGSTTEVLPYLLDAASGISEGVANVLGAPADLAYGAYNAVTGDNIKPMAGSASLKQGMQDIGLTVPQQAQGPLANVSKSAFTELGSMAIPQVGLLGKAKHLKPILVGTPGFFRRFFIEPIAKAPLLTTAAETAAGLGAGAGKGTANELYPGSKTAELTGEIIGGVTPSVLSMGSIPVLSYKLAKKVVSRFSPSRQRETALKQIKKVLGDTITPEIREKVKKVAELQAKMKEQGIEWNPTLAEVTDSPAIMLQQEQLFDNARGGVLEQLIQKSKDNDIAINNYTSAKTPDSDVNAQYIVDVGNNRIETFGHEVDTGISSVNMTKKDMADRIISVDRMVSGKAIRDGINNARSEASIKMSIRAKELGLDDVDLTEHFGDFREGIIEKYKPISRYDDEDALPKIYKKLEGEAKPPDVPEEGVPEFDVLDDIGEISSFNDVKALRERITDDLRNEAGTAVPNSKKERTLVSMRKDVDNFLEELEPILGANYKTFRTEYYENFIVPFQSGAIAKARNKDGTGFYKTNDEQVASVFLDNPSAAKQFNVIFKDDHEMMSAFKDAALDDLKRAAVDDGVLDEKKLKAWTKKRGESIEQIPGLKDEVSDITTAQKQLDNREIQLSNRKKDIENKSFSKKLRTYRKGDVSAEDILDSALKNPIEMRRLKNHVKKSEEALGGLRRTIWGKISDGSSEDIVVFMAKHDKTLMELFPKSQLKDMYDISLMKAINDRSTVPTGSATTGAELPAILKKVEDITGMKVPQFGTRMYAYQSGRVPPHYLALEGAMTALRKNAKRYSDEIWTKALYDPKTVEYLMDASLSGKITEKAIRRIGSRVAVLGLPYTNEEQNGK